MKLSRRLSTLLAIAASLFALFACYADKPSLTTGGSSSSGPDASVSAVLPDASIEPLPDAGASEPPVLGGCRAVATTPEVVPARDAAMGKSVSKPQPAFVKDLFTKFVRACGECHVNGNQGNFRVSLPTFSKDMTDEVLKRIYSTDPKTVMPPGTPLTSRDPNTDPYLLLGAELKAWYDQGKPSDSYFPPASATKASFELSRSVGLALTNLGNCIPDKELVGVREDTMDAFFESAVALPPRLDQTDLTTYDSSVLAQTGVIAFAPAYPLWADDARKIRYVRVPHGRSIQFDKATQQFDIPDNTRFYKTFLKRTIQKDGSERWRKVETRLIVVRHPIPGPNGTETQTALFGTYAWSDDEKQALLVTDPYHNQKPFVDRVFTLVVDEGKNDAIRASFGDAGTQQDLERKLTEARATRTYAIPGSDRCMHCHMGSPSRSFILGFTPLEINRRVQGEGGTIEPATADDLSQFQRLIDYGVITGVTSPDDVLPLEKSQGTRTPRNDYELRAQGYMLGNCAHCHNPRGFPSVQNPDTLMHFLSFMPGTGPIDGIFQFPLDKFSPRIFRDLGGSVKLPYITPSFVDFPGAADANHQAGHEGGDSTGLATDLVLAPWRSLIYRNVDTPFSYSNDLALFPHMPMDTPGFDCRLPKIMAEWMLSIPAKRKHLETSRGSSLEIELLTPEFLVQGVTAQAGGLHDVSQAASEDSPPLALSLDAEPQPYEEVTELSDPNGYAAAAAAAQDRLDAYHGAGRYHAPDGGTAAAQVSPSGRDWLRYDYCPDTTDVVDPTVTGSDVAHLVPSDLKIKKLGDTLYKIPVDYQPAGALGAEYSEDDKRVPSSAELVWPDEGVPDRPHWVVTDTTDSLGPWEPRRSDWKDTLLDHKVCPPPPNNKDSKLADQCRVVEMLSPKDPSKPGVTLTKAVTDYANNLIPYGLWLDKPECNAAGFPGQKKVKDFDGARAKWMDVAKPAADAPVYSVYPGAAIYSMVCINCHGPQADSHGRQADTLQLMTGGTARVANFRDGLFGPLATPGSNRNREFDVGAGATADDWAARYVAWMALGGTQKLIPRSILNVVVRTPVFGLSRQLSGVDSANMLGPVQTLCSQLFGLQFATPDASKPGNGFVRPSSLDPTSVDGSDKLWELTMKYTTRDALFTKNGDAELFARLCTLDNPMPVAIVAAGSSTSWSVRYFPASAYPKAAIGNDQGGVDDAGVLPSNIMPWCVDSSSTSTVPTTDGKPSPLCPDSVMTSLNSADAPLEMTYDDLRAWSFRGAINAGLAAFLYVDKVERGYKPVPQYDHCEALQ